MKTKITTILGTRPEIIRLSSIIKKLDENFNHRLIHTGQNSTTELSEVFFKDLNLREPDKYMSLSTESLGYFLGNLFIEIEKELTLNRPDALVILGDTNSALSGIIAKRMNIPVYHLEAGNRSFDANVPEETNRRIVDHFSDFNLAYSEHAVNNLRNEGLHPRNTVKIGSPLFEVISQYRGEIESSKIISKLKLQKGEYFIVSAHRQENVDDPKRLTELVSSLNAMAIEYEQPIIVTMHPRTKQKLAKINIENNTLIHFHNPFGFIDYCKLQSEARVVLSDSGSISEEAAILGFRAITIRNSMERPEALESGSILMSGIESTGILEAIKIIESGQPSLQPPLDYFIPDSSTRVINFVASTVHQHKFWNGLR
jgi:UDP-N-acetylglucosamine 2-epimerase (non-hydrolysing)